jgi:LPXTG-motif cell wall-anchored protein
VTPAPAPLPEAAPAPAPAPAPAATPAPAPKITASAPSRSTVSHHRHQTRPVVQTKPVSFTPVAAVTAVPQAGVQAGAGGTAGGTDDSLLLGAGLVLVATGGGLMLRRKRATE